MKKKYKSRTKKTFSNNYCENCHRKDGLTIVKTYRINYPSGHHSKPKLTQIRRDDFCLNNRCINYRG